MKAIAYVDGLNLYHGLAAGEGNLLKFRWLDIGALCTNLLSEAGASLGQSVELDAVKYFTSMVAQDQSKRRQDVYIQALRVQNPDLEVYFGKYEMKNRDCNCQCGCHNEVGFLKEKRTDVNLAVHMLTDATLPSNERPDVQLLITNDSDLIPAIMASTNLGLRVVTVAPPYRGRVQMKGYATKTLRIRKRHLKASPLPEILHNSMGYPLTPPDGWEPPSTW